MSTNYEPHSCTHALQGVGESLIVRTEDETIHVHAPICTCTFMYLCVPPLFMYMYMYMNTHCHTYMYNVFCWFASCIITEECTSFIHESYSQCSVICGCLHCDDVSPVCYFCRIPVKSTARTMPTTLLCTLQLKKAIPEALSASWGMGQMLLSLICGDILHCTGCWGRRT